MENLRGAREELGRLFGQSLCSRVYETDPVGCEPGSGPYLNAVVEIEYEGQPVVLLDCLQAVEKKMGRPSKRPRNAPRTIDLDILYVGNLTLSNEEIIIPHPRLHLRRFVLAPLCDISPELILPGRHESVSRLLAQLPAEPTVRRFSRSLD
jgi:2-amino-4-hydroxy-6-hydroxymethyldihydropteridine diphosphokinase